MADSQSYPQGVPHPVLADQEIVMREIIKKMLAEWLAKLERQTEANRAYFDNPDRFEDDKDHDFGDSYLDRHLMGAAKFIADVAEKCHDMELLGIATHVRNLLQAGFDEKVKLMEEHDRFQAEDGAEWTRRDAVALEATRAFFRSVPASVIDMSSYRQAIEEARPYFSNPHDYLALLAYIDDRNVLKRVKSEMNIWRYVHDHNGTIPPHEWMRDKFDAALRDTYRRAGKHVAWRIKRGTPQSPISPIGTDEKT